MYPHGNFYLRKYTNKVNLLDPPLAEFSVFFEKISESRIASFLARKCKTNFVSSRKKPYLHSFSTSRQILARRWLRWHDLVSHGDEVYKNYKWSNSQKKTCFLSRNSKIFCPYDLTLYQQFIRPKFFHQTILNGPICKKKHVSKNKKFFALNKSAHFARFFHSLHLLLFPSTAGPLPASLFSMLAKPNFLNKWN